MYFVLALSDAPFFSVAIYSAFFHLLDISNPLVIHGSTNLHLVEILICFIVLNLSIVLFTVQRKMSKFLSQFLPLSIFVQSICNSLFLISLVFFYLLDFCFQTQAVPYQAAEFVSKELRMVNNLTCHLLRLQICRTYAVFHLQRCYQLKWLRC